MDLLTRPNMPGHPFLNGTTVTLRVVEVTESDIEILRVARNEPELRQPLGFDTPWPTSRVREFVESTVDDDATVNLFVCVAGEEPSRVQQAASSDSSPETTVVGAVNLFDVDNTSGTLSYWLFEAYRGNGYANDAVSLLLDYAFADRGLRRVEAEVFDGNDSSKRLLERLGFVHEGTARDARFSGGAFEDTHLYGLLAPEWTEGEDP